jgi:hypothetical protein
VAFSGTILSSEISYKQILNDVFASDKNINGDDAKLEDNYHALIKSYNFTDGIPKEFLFVSLKPDLP